MNEGTKRTLKRVIDIVIAVLTCSADGTHHHHQCSCRRDRAVAWENEKIRE